MTENKQDWRIDHSAGRPILVYQNCSVIEAEQAEYVLRLIKADKLRTAGAPVAWTNEAGDVEPISDAVKQARPDLYAKGYTRPLFYAAPQASAPVADESPMTKMAEALREKARQERRAYQDRRDHATEWGPMPVGTEADDPSALAALADGLEDIVGNENAKSAAVIIRRMANAEVLNAVLEEAAKACEAVTKGFRIPEPIPATQQAWDAIALCATACRALKSAPAAEDSAKGAGDAALLDALRQIAAWPDGGERYGQEKIKRFAQDAIDAAKAFADRQQRGGDVVQEFIDATDALLESRERKSWNSGYAKDMTPMERGNVAARWRKARAALVAQPAASAEPVGHDGLLPCPFCGRSAHLSRSDELVNVRCDGWNPGECLGAGPNCYTEAEARVGWNRRAALAAHKTGGGGTDAAVAAIRFALEADDGMAWLRCWNEGDFDACRNEWPETPEECFIGADPLHPSTRAILAAQSSDGVEDALRQRLGEALTDAMAQNVDTDTKTFCIDPFNSDNIDPLLDAILKVLTGK